jgi:hypothetical protein
MPKSEGTKMRTVKIESSFTTSNLNKKTAAGFEALDRKFVQIPKEIKEELFVKELKIDYSDKPDMRQLRISDILCPPAFTRSTHFNTFEDLEVLDNPEPVKVVSAEDVKGFFIISGQRRLGFHKLNKQKKIKAIIVGKVVCRSQIAMARALDMTRFKKPAKTLELVSGLLSLYEIIINEFGKEAFFSHGGSRKGEKKEERLSLSRYIADILGLKKSTVNALLNFGHHVGPYGLAGLNYHEDVQKLSIRTINQINAKLKADNLSKKLSEMFHSLQGAKTTELERIKACGNLAHKIILAQIAALTENDINDEKDEEFEQLYLDPSDYDLPPERDKKPKNTDAEGENDDNESEDNAAEKGDDENEDSNFEDEVKEAIKILKRLKHLLPRFETALRNVNHLEKTIQNNLGKELQKFNAIVENMLSFIKRKITDIKLGS